MYIIDVIILWTIFIISLLVTLLFCQRFMLWIELQLLLLHETQKTAGCFFVKIYLNFNCLMTNHNSYKHCCKNIEFRKYFTLPFPLKLHCQNSLRVLHVTTNILKLLVVQYMLCRIIIIIILCYFSHCPVRMDFCEI